jgi:hypothetical protein
VFMNTNAPQGRAKPPAKLGFVELCASSPVNEAVTRCGYTKGDGPGPLGTRPTSADNYGRQGRAWFSLI